MTTYGAGLRDLWPLDPAITYLNHGGFGVTPREIGTLQAEFRAHVEANPMRFMTGEFPAAVRASAAALGEFLGAKADEIVFTENATSGLNAVLRSLDFQPGDEIVIPTLAYGAIMKAARYVATRTGAKLITPEIPFPLPRPQAAIDAVKSALSPRTKLVLVDHIVSPTGFILPVRAIADAAHAVGAQVLIDGAHAPGQIPLVMAETGGDWYVGNLHKWLFVPRACGFLWANGAARHQIHPLAISHGYEQGLIAEFDWTGTHDPTSILCVPAAIAFHQKLGGPALMQRNAALLREALDLVAAAFQTPLGATPDQFASMGTVALPARFGTTDADAAVLRRTLSDDHRIEAVISAQKGSLWLRLAAQAYNEIGDYARLVEVLRTL